MRTKRAIKEMHRAAQDAGCDGRPLCFSISSHASDMTMNSGGSSALPYACRATRNAKIIPVPVVRTNRQTNAASPAAPEYPFIRRSSSVHRYTATIANMPVYRNTFHANTDVKL